MHLLTLLAQLSLLLLSAALATKGLAMPHHAPQLIQRRLELRCPHSTPWYTALEDGGSRLGECDSSCLPLSSLSGSFSCAESDALPLEYLHAPAAFRARFPLRSASCTTRMVPAATSEEKGEKGKGLDDAEAKEVLRAFAASCEEAGGILTRPRVPLW
ncbi:hypothetical protein FA09DRAFT_330499 [Tilletiopsis washingtonensis]|uniref:Uncharacterized protein n=1 Tax=Tilletiopsis washingtonensis TaxID=58919 RepID=A0A316Z7V2_9BASI|nr:hypothetical protein FA09DRAFT_330499 [Tilletiopsis washingtonensis]PWN97336.1 hypothetical protein FA09DRAFT_330499 [Tilletiopsis washingtonensis]